MRRALYVRHPLTPSVLLPFKKGLKAQPISLIELKSERVSWALRCVALSSHVKLGIVEEDGKLDDSAINGELVSFQYH